MKSILNLSGEQHRSGATMIIVIVALVVLVSMVAFAIDVGRMTGLRSEIQNAVDSGALAAGLKLRAEPTNILGAAEEATRYVQMNEVGRVATVPEDVILVEVGTWDDSTKTFTVTNVDPTSVRVMARQDKEPSSFGAIMGVETFGAPATAIVTAGGSSLDIMMVLDLSGSMNYQGRIQALRNSAPVFVDVIEQIGGDDLIAVMGLSADPSNFTSKVSSPTMALYSSGLHSSSGHHVGVLEHVLTDQFSTLRSSVLSSSNLVASKYNGWTGTGASLGDAAHCLIYSAEARPSAKKIIVLMSDGYANRPSTDGPGYALSMANYAASLGIEVYTISLGNGADVTLMQDIATKTNGKHFDATGSGVAELTAKLTEAFEQIAYGIKKTQLVL